MSHWIVVEYDRVDVTRMEDQEPRYAPGQPSQATVVEAPDTLAALRMVADSAGFFKAIPLPGGPPSEHVVVRSQAA